MRMRFGKTLSALSGALAGLVLGFLLWGIELSEIRWTLTKTTQELSQAQMWLRDEIRTSDERYEQVSGTLKKALADLAQAQANLTRTSAVLRSPVAPSASPPTALRPTAPSSSTAPSLSPSPSLSTAPSSPIVPSPPTAPEADLRWAIPPQ
jgi:hypothetical protein